MDSEATSKIQPLPLLHLTRTRVYFLASIIHTGGRLETVAGKPSTNTKQEANYHQSPTIPTLRPAPAFNVPPKYIARPTQLMSYIS